MLVCPYGFASPGDLYLADIGVPPELHAELGIGLQVGEAFCLVIHCHQTKSEAGSSYAR